MNKGVLVHRKGAQIKEPTITQPGGYKDSRPKKKGWGHG